MATAGPIRPFTRLRQLLRPDAFDIFLILAFALLVAILSLATPITVQAMVNTVMFRVVVWPIVWLAAILFFCLAFAAFLTALETVVIERLQVRLFARVALDFAERLPRVRLASLYQPHPPADITYFFDVLTVQKSAATLLLEGTGLVIATVVGMVVLAFYHPYLLAFDLVIIALMIVLAFLGVGGVRSNLDESEEKYATAGWLRTLARHPILFKTGTAPLYASERLEEQLGEYVADRRRHFNVVFRQIVFAMLVQVGAGVTLLGLGGYLVMREQLTIGQLVAAEIIVSMVIGVLSKLGKHLDAYYDLLSACEKLGMVTDLPTEDDSLSPLELPRTDAGMRVEGPSQLEPGGKYVRHQAGTRPVEEELERLAGLVENDHRYDGVAWRDLKLDSFRTQAALVREPEIFDGTVSDNLRVAAGMEALAEAPALLRLAGLHESIDLSTQLGEGGLPLSREEAARLALVRALLQKPRLLVIDGLLDRIDETAAAGLVDAVFSRAGCTVVVRTTKASIAERGKV